MYHQTAFLGDCEEPQLMSAKILTSAATRTQTSTNQHNTRFEVSTMVNVKIMFLLNMMSCALADRYQHFEGTCCLHLQGKEAWAERGAMLCDREHSTAATSKPTENSGFEQGCPVNREQKTEQVPFYRYAVIWLHARALTRSQSRSLSSCTPSPSPPPLPPDPSPPSLIFCYWHTTLSRTNGSHESPIIPGPAHTSLYHLHSLFSYTGVCNSIL
jgi:hypothetical protein